MNESTPGRLPEGDTDRKHGEHMLAIFEEDAKRRQDADPLLESIRQAFEAKASEAEADKQ
jgi:hypothetical protein